MKRRFFVYLLANRPRGVLYIGVTNDLMRRLIEHKAKLVPGFTKTYGVIKLVYYEEYSSILEARAREATLKRWRRAWKIELVDKFNPDWRDLSNELALCERRARVVHRIRGTRRRNNHAGLRPQQYLRENPARRDSRDESL